jgi:ATP-dependent helicase HrpB
MPEHELPEVRRVDLAGALLQLAQWGARDASAFAWYETPERGALERAGALLVELGALEAQSGALTQLGSELASVPAHPRLARMLIEARELGVLEAGAELAALLGSRARSERGAPGSFVARRGPRSAGPSDLLARWEDWHAALAGRGSARFHAGEARRIEQSAAQLARTAARTATSADSRGPHVPAPEDEDEALLRVIWAGFPDRLARRLQAGEPEALSIGGQGLVLAPESVVLDEEFFVALELEAGAPGSWGSQASQGAAARARVRLASAVRREWLEAQTQHVRSERLTRFDEARGRVIGLVRRSYRGLALEQSETGAPDAHEAARLLLEQLRADPPRWLRLPEEAQRLRTRLQSIAAWMPELAWPDFGDEGLLELLPAWLEGCTSLQQLRELDWVAILRAALAPAQSRALERNAPDALALPTGRNARLEYAPGKPPVLAVRLQELFGLPESPRVADGRVAVLLHLLAPNGRVVQVTSDLASFWNNTYAQVRKDLRARYPRHAWPEDPWSAPPSARPKPRPRS